MSDLTLWPCTHVDLPVAGTATLLSSLLSYGPVCVCGCAHVWVRPSGGQGGASQVTDTSQVGVCAH